MAEGSAGRIRVGMAGWVYPPWRGTFYPEKLPQSRELEFASRAVSTIELNASFYSLQRPESYARWHDETPDDFVFAVKAPRYITHIRRLRDVETPMANFFASGPANLRAKLGPVLWQLPPNLKYDAAVLEAFAAALPRDSDAAAELAQRHDTKVEGRAKLDFGPRRALRHAIEIRNASFAVPEAIATLRRHGVAVVFADSAGKFPECHDLAADFVYLRLHGADEASHPAGYTDAAIARFAAHARAWCAGGEPDEARRISGEPAPVLPRRDVYAYFDHTVKASTPANAQRLLRALGLEPARVAAA